MSSDLTCTQFFFFFQAEDGIRDHCVTGVQTCALPISYLAENKNKEGVKTTPSGLQYKVITAGTGKVPTTGDTVVTQYRGTFIDGKEFDSSYKRGEPFVTAVTSVIKGWTEALTMMPVGSKWQLFIPPDLAYGPGKGSIPPNATLLFDMDVLSIQEKGK